MELLSPKKFQDKKNFKRGEKEWRTNEMTCEEESMFWMSHLIKCAIGLYSTYY